MLSGKKTGGFICSSNKVRACLFMISRQLLLDKSPIQMGKDDTKKQALRSFSLCIEFEHLWKIPSLLNHHNLFPLV